MQMQFKELFLFSPSEKVARRIAFSKGINIITSRKIDGTNRGKSVVMRSLYHTLGAETFLEQKFDAKHKVFILHFNVDAESYYILRSANLYKVFDASRRLMFVATRGSELAEKLKSIIQFSVMLPDRSASRLEVTPPAYSYLPYFLDQDHYSGSKFSSFNNLAQYENYKVNALLCHFGVYTLSYFTLVQELEQINDEVAKLHDRTEVLKEVLSDVSKKMEVEACSGDIAALQRDVGHYQQRYSNIIQQLNESKVRLVKLRNSLSDFMLAEKELSRLAQKNEGEIAKLLLHKCPECNSTIDNTLVLRGRRYNLSEDVRLVMSDIQTKLHELNQSIAEEEGGYTELLALLNQYEQALKINHKEVKDILRYKGLCEVRNGVAEELQGESRKMELAISRQNDVKKRIKVYGEEKAKVNKTYYEILLQAKLRFGLDEIAPELLMDIKKNFEASGSDKYIATVIWYITIIRLRNQFNPNVIRFPIVFDSPNNVENDDQKTRELFQYLFENSDLSEQFIISGIGLDTDEFRGVINKPMNTVVLQNEQFHLLQKDDYVQYSSLLMELLAAEEP